MSALLSVRDLSVGFGRDPAANEVVKGVSFTLEAGKTLAIVGESGSGKSVTALSINRLIDFGGGRITGGSMQLKRADGTIFDLMGATEPQLRGIRDTGPYFHDNSAKTLEDVMVHYNKFFGGFLTPQDQVDIVAYMKLLR